MSTPDRDHNATQRAIDAALRAQAVEAQLKSHEARLNAINGSIDRSAKAINALEAKIDTAAEVAKAVADKSVSTRTLLFTAAGIVVSLGSILAGTGHT